MIYILFLLLLCSCAYNEKDYYKIKQIEKTKKYLSIIEDFYNKIKPEKDIYKIEIGGSRSENESKEFIVSDKIPELKIGYGNDIFSDLDVKITTKNYLKYCDCHFINKKFKTDLCKIYKFASNKNSCHLSIVKDSCFFDFLFIDRNSKQASQNNVIDFLMYAFESQNLIFRQNKQSLSPRKFEKLVENLNIMISDIGRFAYIENFSDKFYDDIQEWRKYTLNKKKQQKLLTELINKFVYYNNVIAKKNNTKVQDEISIGLKILDELKKEANNKY